MQKQEGDGSKGIVGEAGNGELEKGTNFFLFLRLGCVYAWLNFSVVFYFVNG